MVRIFMAEWKEIPKRIEEQGTLQIDHNEVGR